ncbi:MAG: helix-turn-helix domain-containing protein [Thermoplasmata archaeon]|nr:helix-turn-helix domain-containing protein [Thermoplasmata archaeon]
MSLWEAYFQCQYDFPLSAISTEIPTTPLYAGCLGDRSWVQVPTLDGDTIRKVATEISRAGGKIVRSSRSGDSHLFLIAERWSRHGGLHRLFEASKCRLTIPWMYQDGWGYFRVLSLDGGRLRSLLSQVGKNGELRLIRKTEMPVDVLPTTTWIQGVFSELTPKQAEAVLQAHRAGYYLSPRNVTRGQIAQKLGVGRTTFEEHIRKAERKVMNALVPALTDYTRTDRAVSIRWGRRNPSPEIRTEPNP